MHSMEGGRDRTISLHGLCVAHGHMEEQSMEHLETLLNLQTG